MDDVTAAKILIGCLDLTSLGDHDTEYRIEDLCAKADTPYGHVAAVCIWPQFIPLAKRNSKNTCQNCHRCQLSPWRFRLCQTAP